MMGIKVVAQILEHLNSALPHLNLEGVPILGIMKDGHHGSYTEVEHTLPFKKQFYLPVHFFLQCFLNILERVN